jgi:hypothetical protein
MEWSSPQVEARLRQANIILESPGVSVAAEVGVVRGILLWPAYQASKKNPDGMRLEEVLSPDVFRRWIAFKHRFLGDDRSVDRLRPLFAAKALFNAALRDSGMNDESLVEPVVRRLAKRFSIPLQSTSVRLTVSDPRETLSKLNASHLNDQECLVRTMDRLEHDLAIMTLRANAWAEGDIDKLKALPFIDQKEACKLALMNNEIAREHGITDLDARVQQQWLTAVRTALSEKDTVFATLPIAKLLDGNGVLRTLQDEGFVVNAPE